MKLVNNIIEYQSIVKKYRQKGVRSNDYLQQEVIELIKRDALFANCYNNNAFLFVKNDVGIRLYYYINDLNEIANLSKYKDLVTEVLFRAEIPQEEINYLIACGMSINLRRDLYSTTSENIHLSLNVKEVYVRYAESLSDIIFACNLFNSIFDKYSGDYIPTTSYQVLLDKRQILLAIDSNGGYLGAFHYTIEKNVNWVSHIAVLPEFRGKGVANALLNEFIRITNNGPKTKYMLWVQNKNNAAIQMYQKMGFKYVNRSTLSLIKTI